MISLNGVELSSDLVIREEFAIQENLQSITRNLDGGVVVSNLQIVSGTSLVLGSAETTSGISGYFTREQIIAIKQFEKTSSIISLIYEGKTYIVMVITGGVDVVPVLDRPDHELTDWYTGSITFLVI